MFFQNVAVFQQFTWTARNTLASTGFITLIQWSVLRSGNRKESVVESSAFTLRSAL
jgi:hypothetical protein